MLPALARFIRTFLYQRADLTVRVAYDFKNLSLSLWPQLRQILILVVALFHYFALSK